MQSLFSASEILGPDGPFVASIKDFVPRYQQQEMAQAVALALEESQTLVAEAGTGTGKTFAYLVPAVLSGKKIIISTGTRNLQEQLYYRDLPNVKRIVKSSATTAMLKGRSNYLCLHRLNLHENNAHSGVPSNQHQIQKIHQWLRRSESGDISEVADIPENAPIWMQVTSTSDNCLGQDCPDISECHVLKARKKAQQADLVIINHHLLFSDMSLREEGFGELLPSANGFILDEAHQIPDIASIFFGKYISSRQLLELARDSVVEYNKEAGDMPALPDMAVRLDKRVSALRRSFGARQGRTPWQNFANAQTVNECLKRLIEELDGLNNILEELAPRGKGLESCWRRSSVLRQRLSVFDDNDEDGHIVWVEITAKGFILHETPLDIAEIFQASIKRYDSSWVFSSATLSVGNSFEHFTNTLGLHEATTHQWDSPFDYAHQARLYLPTDLPEPSSSHYTSAIVEAALPVLNASGGRAFMLFTSHRALRKAASLLEDGGLIDFPLLVQGTAPRNELLEQFRKLGNAVLLGTGSFWEGVDVKGAALSCVIIDKLPFATPDDPVFKARAELMVRRGANPFRDYQVPNAVITLKQGAGRLIRDTDDYGVMMLCDPRLLSKSYGKTFLRNIPPMKMTRSLADIQSFFNNIKNDHVEKNAEITSNETVYDENSGY